MIDHTSCSNVRSGNTDLFVCSNLGIEDLRKSPYLMFLHGSPGQISNWKYQAKYFSRRYGVIVPDLRGYGKSGKPEEVSLQDYLNDIDELMKHYGLRPEETVLIGHSFGGMVAQAYASTKPLLGLVLIGSLVKLKPGLMSKFIWRAPPILWRRLLFTENFLTRRMYRSVFFSPCTPDEVYEEFIADNKEYLETAPAKTFTYLKHFTDYDASRFAHKINSPTLLIVGVDDVVTPPKESIRLNELIPKSRLEIVECAGHMILYEKPEVLNNLIERFIEEIANGWIR